MQIKSTYRHILSTNGDTPGTRRAPAQRSEQYHEKHRAPARASRAGVYGGSAPDGHRVIKIIHQSVDDDPPPLRVVGGRGALAPGKCPCDLQGAGACRGMPYRADPAKRARAIAREPTRVAPPQE